MPALLPLPSSLPLALERVFEPPERVVVDIEEPFYKRAAIPMPSVQSGQCWERDVLMLLLLSQPRHRHPKDPGQILDEAYRRDFITACHGVLVNHWSLDHEFFQRREYECSWWAGQ